MIKVLHLITGLDTGGAERMLERVATRMDREEFLSVVVTLTQPGQTAQALIDGGICVHTLNLKRGVPDPRGLWRLAQIVSAFQPDIQQTWLYHADLLGLLGRRMGLAGKLLWNVRCTDSIGSGMVRRLLAHWSATPDAILINSQAGQRFHEAIGYRARQWVYIPNGFDTEILRPDPALRRRQRARLGVDESTFVILLPARYHLMKDHTNFLAAAAKFSATHRDVQFILAGHEVDSSNHDLCRAISSHGLGDCTLLLGERHDLDNIYPAADVVTLSSAFGEGFPNVLGEAMCCGIPCVATDVGDASVIIGETGIVVEPRDPSALAAAWQELAALSAEERMALGAAARARALDNFDLNAVVAQYETFYRQIFAQSQASKSIAN
ncbi:MAG TPA: glycosyltransferase [Stellaceae bacterium]|nr:glycosyltransferase [Stellaceae bacterium]